MELIYNAPIFSTITILLSFFVGYRFSKWVHSKRIEDLKSNTLLYENRIKNKDDILISKDEYIKRLESGAGVTAFKKRMIIEIDNFLSYLKEFINKKEKKLKYDKKMTAEWNPEMVKSNPKILEDMNDDHNIISQYEKYREMALNHFDFLSDLIGREPNENEKNKVRNPSTFEDIKWIGKEIENMKTAVSKIN